MSELRSDEFFGPTNWERRSSKEWTFGIADRNQSRIQEVADLITLLPVPPWLSSKYTYQKSTLKKELAGAADPLRFALL